MNNLENLKEKLPPPNGKPCVSILSGGLDSTILTYLLVHYYGKDNVHALIFFYEQKHSIEVGKAINTCEKLGIQYKVLDISFLGEINRDFSSLSSKGSIQVQKTEEMLGLPQPVQYVANRNSILINIAVGYAETIKADKVFYGAQSYDSMSGFWDTTKTFVESINKTLWLNREHSIEVYAPFLEYWKDDEIRLGIELEVPFEDTWTCYDPQIEEYTKPLRACGVCSACCERKEAFKRVGIPDPIEYIKVN
jgi:7-cyano-7-deazaguanine synthase